MTKTKAPETALATIAPLQQALALATEAGDIEGLRDVAAMATALQKGARARGMGIESENQAAEIILRAERSIGHAIELLKESGQFGKAWARGVPPTNKGAAVTTTGVREDHRDRNEVVLLKDLGLSWDQSKNFQRLAKLPESVFEDKLATFKEIGSRIAKIDFYRLVNQPEKVKREATTAIVADQRAEADTSVFAKFENAASDLIEGMDQLPNDELARVAGLIMSLKDAYMLAKAARQ